MYGHMEPTKKGPVVKDIAIEKMMEELQSSQKKKVDPKDEHFDFISDVLKM